MYELLKPLSGKGVGLHRWNETNRELKLVMVTQGIMHIIIFTLVFVSHNKGALEIKKRFKNEIKLKNYTFFSVP